MPASQATSTQVLLEAWNGRYRSALVRFFERRTPSHCDHEDLAQEVFRRLAQRSELDTVERVEAYLFQTADGVLNDYLRKRHTRMSDAMSALMRRLNTALA